MEITDKYPLLEQSKRIAELLGENAPESGYVWISDSNSWSILVDQTNRDDYESMCTVTHAAYDLAELGEMLVSLGATARISWKSTALGLLWSCEDGSMPAVCYSTEAQARAALLIYLLEHRLRMRLS